MTEYLDLSLIEIMLAIGIVAIGTAVQASLGFGVALVAAPFLLLINRNFVPGPLIATALCLVLWMAWTDRRSIDYGHFKAALYGRLIGAPLGALLIGSISDTAFDMIFGVLVLLAIGVSLVHADIRATPVSVFFATMASGFMSTISAIGGPPLALVYQNARGAALRANLAVLFIMGCIISLLALSLVGKFHLKDLAYSAVLLVGVAPGVACSRPLKRRIDKQSARPFLLGLCALSALVVLGRALSDIL